MVSSILNPIEIVTSLLVTISTIVAIFMMMVDVNEKEMKGERSMLTARTSNGVKYRSFAIAMENGLVKNNEFNRFKLRFLRSARNSWVEYTDDDIRRAYKGRVTIYLKDGSIFQAWKLEGFKDRGDGIYHAWMCDDGYPKEVYNDSIKKIVDAEGKRVPLTF